MENDYYVYVYPFCGYDNDITKCQTYKIKLIGGSSAYDEGKVDVVWLSGFIYSHTERFAVSMPRAESNIPIWRSFSRT